MSLIEIMVAMAIVGILFAVAATGLRSVFNVNLKATSSSLASTLRYLSNKSVTEHQYLRMVYDLDEQSYRAEASADPFVITPEDEESAKKDKAKAANVKRKKDNASEAEAGEDTAPEAAPAEDSEEEAEKPVFSEIESPLLKPKKLPSGVLFKDVTVSYKNGKQESGQVYTYFFPDGFATPTLINLKDDNDEDHFSLELFPLSGRVKITSEYRERMTQEKK
jgi:prepilin-type N-terminal cleavage/methylation domain-containing protein